MEVPKRKHRKGLSVLLTPKANGMGRRSNILFGLLVFLFCFLLTRDMEFFTKRSRDVPCGIHPDSNRSVAQFRAGSCFSDGIDEESKRRKE